jgi:hypothetical protein
MDNRLRLYSLPQGRGLIRGKIPRKKQIDATRCPDLAAVL